MNELFYHYEDPAKAERIVQLYASELSSMSTKAALSLIEEHDNASSLESAICRLVDMREGGIGTPTSSKDDYDGIGSWSLVVRAYEER